MCDKLLFIVGTVINSTRGNPRGCVQGRQYSGLGFK